MTDRIEKARQELDAICAMETRTQAEIFRDVRATMLRLNGRKGRTGMESRLGMNLAHVADDGALISKAAQA